MRAKTKYVVLLCGKYPATSDDTIAEMLWDTDTTFLFEGRTPEEPVGPKLLTYKGEIWYAVHAWQKANEMEGTSDMRIYCRVPEAVSVP